MGTRHFTKETFKAEVLDSDKPVLVDFWAQWCGPCRAVAPILEELADEYDKKAVIGKVNVDEESEIAQQYRIMSIPTVMVFKNGEVVDKIIGARTKNDYILLINKYL